MALIAVSIIITWRRLVSLYKGLTKDLTTLKEHDHCKTTQKDRTARFNHATRSIGDWRPYRIDEPGYRP
jgi:hypothetical protein